MGYTTPQWGETSASFSPQIEISNLQHLTFLSPEVINLKLLPIVSLQYLAIGKWEYQNLSGRSCYLDLIPNSPRIV